MAPPPQHVEMKEAGRSRCSRRQQPRQMHVPRGVIAVLAIVVITNTAQSAMIADDGCIYVYDVPLKTLLPDAAFPGLAELVTDPYFGAPTTPPNASANTWVYSSDLDFDDPQIRGCPAAGLLTTRGEAAGSGQLVWRSATE